MSLLVISGVLLFVAGLDLRWIAVSVDSCGAGVLSCWFFA